MLHMLSWLALIFNINCIWIERKICMRFTALKYVCLDTIKRKKNRIFKNVCGTRNTAIKWPCHGQSSEQVCKQQAAGTEIWATLLVCSRTAFYSFYLQDKNRSDYSYTLQKVLWTLLSDFQSSLVPRNSCRGLESNAEVAEPSNPYWAHVKNTPLSLPGCQAILGLQGTLEDLALPGRGKRQTQ